MKPWKLSKFQIFQIVLGLTSKQCGCVWCFHCLPRWISPQVSSKSDSGVCQCQRSRRKFGSARHSKSPHAAARLRFVSFCAKQTTQQVFIKIPEWHKVFQGLQVPSLLLLSITVTLRTWKIHEDTIKPKRSMNCNLIRTLYQLAPIWSFNIWKLTSTKPPF